MVIVTSLTLSRITTPGDAAAVLVRHDGHRARRHVLCDRGGAVRAQATAPASVGRGA